MHFLEWKVCNLFRISLRFVPKSPMANKCALVQVMAWRHYLNQCWSSSPIHICGIMVKWAKIIPFCSYAGRACSEPCQKPPDRECGSRHLTSWGREDPPGAEPPPCWPEGAQRTTTSRRPTAAGHAAQVSRDDVVLPVRGPVLPVLLHLLLPVGTVHGGGQSANIPGNGIALI